MQPHRLPPTMLTSTTARLREAGCVFAEDEAELLIAAAGSPIELEGMLQQRVAGLPLEHILGWAQFCGLRIIVAPGVFVPRRRTEFLVQQASSLTGAHAVVLDLCCGSGAIGAAMASLLGEVQLYASDIDPVAVECARGNLLPLGGQVFEGDLFAPLPLELQGRVGILVANTPYVPTEAIPLMPPEARLHEARMALDGGSDGLDIQRRVASEASRWLAPGGHLLVETSQRQAPLTAELFATSGLNPWVAASDELDSTIVIGTNSPR